MADDINTDQAFAGAPSESSDGRRNKKTQVKKYDFKRPKLVSNDIMQALRKIHISFARRAKRIFTSALNLEVEIYLDEVEQVICSEFVNQFSPPTALFLFNITELQEWVVLQTDPGFCTFFVAYQSGGRSIELGERRSLSRIEEKVMGHTIDKLLNELTEIWSPYLQMTINDHAYESKPANVRTISHLAGISAIFHLQIGQLTIPLRICYPYTMLKEQMKSSFEKLDTGTKKQSLTDGERLRFKDEMKGINVTATAMLGETTLPLQKLLDLGEGDLIKLKQHIRDPLPVLVNKRLTLQGYPGKKSGNKAIKIFDIINS